MNKTKALKRIISLVCVTTIMSTSLLSNSVFAKATEVDSSPTEESRSSDTLPSQSSDIYTAFGLDNTQPKLSDTEDVNPYGQDKTSTLVFNELVINNNVNKKTLLNDYDYNILKDGKIYDGVTKSDKINYVTRNSYPNNSKKDFIATKSDAIDLLNTGKESYVAKVGLTENGKNYDVYLSIDNVTTSTNLLTEYISTISTENYNVVMGSQFNGLLDIVCGNFDDDDLDEIAVYAPSTDKRSSIIVYDLNVEPVNETATQSSSEVHDSSHDYDDVKVSINRDKTQVLDIKNYSQQVKSSSGVLSYDNCPLVDLTTGDLTGNDKDEIVITTSNLLFSSMTDKNSIVPLTTILSYNGEKLEKIYSVSNKWEYEDEGGNKTTNYSFFGSAIIGDFDGDLNNELIIAGYDLNDEKDGISFETSQVNIQMIKYSYSDKKFILNPYNSSNDDSKNSEFNPGIVVDLKTPKTDISLQFLLQMASVALDSRTAQTQLFIEGVVFNFDESNNKFNEIFNGDIYKELGYNVWIESVSVGNFNNTPLYTEQLLISVCNSVSDKVYRQFMLFEMDASTSKISKTVDDIESFASNKLSNYDLQAVDTDSDSCILTYEGRSQYFTDPEVFTILQASPYFRDLVPYEDTYAWDGSTSIGSSNSTGTVLNNSIGAHLNATIGYENEITDGVGLFDVVAAKIGGFRAVAEFSAGAGYERSKVSETTYSINYSSDSLTDRVILGMVPMVRYTYEMYIPESNMPTKSEYESELERLKSDEDALNEYIDRYKSAFENGYDFGDSLPPMTVPYHIDIPKEFRTSVMDVEVYDEVANTFGYEPIKGNIISNEVGDPSSYSQDSKELKNYISASSEFDYVPQGGGEISQEVESSESTEQGVEWNGGVAINIEKNTMGVVTGGEFGIDYSGAYLWTDTSSTVYEGSVKGIPSDAIKDGFDNYDFKWQFGSWNDTINGQDCLVLGYLTQNVESSPKNVENISVLETTDTSVTLNWSSEDNQKGDKIEIQVANYPSENFITHATIDADKDTVVLTDLSPHSIYEIRIKTIGTDNNFATLISESPYSHIIQAETQPKQGDGTPIIKELNDYYTYSGETAFFKTVVTTPSDSEISYQWQYFSKSNTGKSEWKDVKNHANISELTLYNVSAKDDGNFYRCKISQMIDGQVLTFYTNAATLHVRDILSKTTLSIDETQNTASGQYVYNTEETKYSTLLLSATYQNQVYDVLEYDVDNNDETLNNFIIQNNSNAFSIKTDTKTEKLIKEALDYNSTQILITNTEDLTKLVMSYEYNDDSGKTIISGDINFKDMSGTVMCFLQEVTVTGYYYNSEENYVIYQTTPYSVDNNIYTYIYSTDLEVLSYPDRLPHDVLVRSIPISRVPLSLEDDNRNVYDEDNMTKITVQHKYTESVPHIVPVEGQPVTLTAQVETLKTIANDNAKLKNPTGTIKFEIFNNNSDYVDTITCLLNEENKNDSSGKSTISYEWTPTEAGEYVIIAEYYGNDNLEKSSSNEVTYNAISINSTDEKQETKQLSIDLKDTNTNEIVSPIINNNESVLLDIYNQVTNMKVEDGNQLIDYTLSREDIDTSKVIYEVSMVDGRSAEGFYTIENNIFTPLEYGEYLITATYNNEIKQISKTIISVVPNRQDDLSFAHKNITQYTSENVIINQLDTEENANVTFKSSDNSVVTVDKNGTPSIISDGTAIITAISKISGKVDVEDSYELTVIDDSSSVINPEDGNDDNNTDNDNDNNKDDNDKNNSNDNNSNSDNDDNSTGSSSSNVISTGDLRNIGLLLLLLSISATIIIVTMKKKKLRT